MSEIRRAIERGMATNNLSRPSFAAKAKIGLSTLDRIMSGARAPTFEQLVRISDALGLDVTAAAGERPVPHVAPDALGGYSRGGVTWMEARYLSLRFAFQREGAILANALAIFWDDQRSSLVFVRNDSPDGPVVQRGQVSISTRTGHTSLVANEFGSHDLTIVGRPGDGGRLQGLCATSYLHRGAPTPASSPIVLVPLSADADAPAYGLIEAGHASFTRYLRFLELVERDGFAKLVSGKVF